MQTVPRVGTSWWLLPGAQLLESVLGPSGQSRVGAFAVALAGPGFPWSFLDCVVVFCILLSAIVSSSHWDIFHIFHLITGCLGTLP